MKKNSLICLLISLSFASSAMAEEVKLIACQNSVEMIDYGLDLIEQAQQSIEFSPCFFGGEVCQKYLAAIEKRMKLNKRLQVYVMLAMTLMEDKDKVYMDQIEGLYPRQFHVVYTTSVIDISKDLSAIDNHVKMLVVDERYFTVGGTNYDDSMCTDGSAPVERHDKPGVSGFVAANLPSGSRDQDLIGKSQLIARELRQIFHKLFALWTDYNIGKRFTSKDPSAFIDKWIFSEIDPYKRPYVKRFENDENAIVIDSSKIQIFLGTPVANPNPITQAYCHLINEAKQEIEIGNLYFSPVDTIMDALKDASNRGIKITVVTNGIHDHSPSYTKLFAWANRISYLPIVYGRDFHMWEKGKCKNTTENAVAFYEYDVDDILYHKKIMVVDKRYLVIGSFNLGHRSDMSDYEIAIVIDSEELTMNALKPLNKDLTHSLKVSSEQMQDWYFDPIIFYKAEVQKIFHSLM